MKSARKLTKRSQRSQHRRFLAEGPQAVREALAVSAGAEDLVTVVFGTGDCARREPGLVAAAAAAGVCWHDVADDVLRTLAQTVTPQGVVAVCRFVDRPLEQLVAHSPRLLAVCADVRDPGNAGTVIRCADAAGADGVVLAGSSVDPYNGKVVRATAGSLFHLPLSVGVPVSEAVSTARSAGLRVLAADGSGDVDLFEAESSGLLAGPVAWLFGNEAWGLPDDVAATADSVVRVPIRGRAESLNLATAAAVCLYASARARR
ncbi:MAG TPA: RNA methyltransferase [Nocardioidaceae bacterium]|nr:RNA methyltransferase [Nocardioidaceae bacterium]